MKICSDCGESKLFEFFTRDKRNKDGRTGRCLACTLVRNRAWIAANPERNRELKQASKKRLYTIEKRRKEYLQGNIERRKVMTRAWKDRNREKLQVLAIQRKKYIKQRTPGWLSKEDKQLIAGIYKVARIFSENSETQYHVDHILPMRGKTVSGLHVPGNLRILEASENHRKYNNLIDQDRMLNHYGY